MLGSVCEYTYIYIHMCVNVYIANATYLCLAFHIYALQFPMFYAAKRGNLNEVQDLLARGAKVNVKIPFYPEVG